MCLVIRVPLLGTNFVIPRQAALVVEASSISGLVEGLGSMDVETGGRPAELFRFRRELLAARPASGLSLPLLRD